MSSWLKHQKTILQTMITSILLLVMLAVPLDASAQDALNLVIHYVQGTPKAGEVAYNVEVFLSVFDSQGTPVNDLSAENFILTEDSQRVELDEVDMVHDQNINVVLVLDTSGSMTGIAIDRAKIAASNFIAGMQEGDQVAVKSFNQEITTVTPFTADLDTARFELSKVEAKLNTGTCLYDAAYDAIQTAATVTAGRRAVILLTDGMDQISIGTVCSIHTIDDVINLASEGSTRVPIYTLGLGNKVDEQSLQRMASMTGGSYLYSPDSTQLEGMFNRLSEQLKSEYVLRYTSTSGPGAHVLVAKVNYEEKEAQDSRNFLLPELPPGITIVSPSEGQQINGEVKITTSIRGQDDLVGKVSFEINGEPAGSDTTLPFELEWDFTDQTGAMEIVAIAYGIDGQELDRTSITVQVAAATQPATPTTIVRPSETSVPEPTQTPVPEAQEDQGFFGLVIDNLVLILIGLAILLAFIIAVVIALIALRSRKEKKKVEEAWFDEPAVTMTFSHEDMDPTMDGFVIPIMDSENYGTLTVLKSDDVDMAGQILNLSKSPTTIGRSVDNDIIFPRDTPVSRFHAIIEKQNNTAVLREVTVDNPDGTTKRPTYGTFINEQQVGEQPVSLQSGDEIRLGNRLVLRYDAAAPDISENATLDGFSIPPQE